MSDWHVLGLDGDPTPGDPDRTAGLAGRLLHQAELADSNQRRLEAVAAGGGDLHMQGDYAPKFIEVLAELPKELGKLSTAYRGAGEAVRSFASDLRQEKSRAATALRNGTDAVARYDGALREIRSLLPSGKELVVSPMLGVEGSVEQATEGLDEGTRSRARSAAQRAGAAERDKAAARRLADQAAQLRGEAEGRAVDAINHALDHSGIKNKSWWQKAWDVVSWPFQSWDNFVKFCRGAAFVIGTIALFISGPVGWALVGVALVAGAVAFGDTLVKFTQGKASLADLALDALGLIPGSAGAIRLAGLGTRLAEAGPRLLAMARDLPETGRLVLAGLRESKTAIADSLRGSLESMRTFARQDLGRFVGRDPIDMATGEMILQQSPDLSLPGVLPFVLQRTYRSAYRVGRWFGRSWSSTIEHRLEIDALGVCYAADDGVLLAYPMPAVGETVLPAEGPRLPLTRDAEGFTVSHPASGRTFHFATGAGTNGDRPAAMLPLSAITDRNAHRIDFGYDTDGALRAISHSGGYRLDVDTHRGLVTEIRLRTPPGEGDRVLMRYRYDDRGNLVGVVNSSGRPLRFGYDERGRMVRWEDRNGTWYRYTYDDLDRCVATSGAGGCLDGTVRYDKSERTTVETNSLGHATTYHFNDLLQVERVVDAFGGVTRYEWDRYDRKLAETDPLGRTTRYGYDEAGNLTGVTRPDGSSTTYAYNDLRLPVTITRPDGTVWQRAYDERGNLVAETDPLGATTAYAYDEQGHLVRQTDALGHARHIETDLAGLAVSVTDPLGATTRYTRDALGRTVEITDALGGVTHLHWTIEGKLASRTRPDGTTDRWIYDPEGNVVEQTDPLGGTIRTEIGHFDLPRSRTGPDGARMSYAYDTELRIVSVTNAQGLVWRYEYDPAGNLVKETDFNGRVLRYTYDAAGQVVEHVNGAGESVSLSLDPLGNVVERQAGDALTTFSHDALGRLTAARNADCELALSRDPLGRILVETCNGRTVTSAYDALGRRLERRTPSGATSTWTYGPTDLPQTLDMAGEHVAFSHDGLGQEIERRLAAGVVIEQRWDAGRRLASQTVTASVPGPAAGGRLVQRRSYSYRADGFAVSIDDLLGGRRQLDLDPVGRITAVSGSGGDPWDERYAYDLDGNLTLAAWPEPPAGPQDTGLGAQGERVYERALLRRAGNVRYEHDAQGRVVLRQEKRLSAKPRTWRYTWDADDRLTGIVTPDGERWRYGYDPLGRRIVKERLAGDQTVAERVLYAWDGFVLAEELHADGPEHVAEASAGRCTTWEWEPGTTRPIAQTRRAARDIPQEEVDAQFHLIVCDLVGTPTELISPGGDIGWRRRASVWGVSTSQEAEEADCLLRFPGQCFDAETGSHYNLFRYYDPAAARYLTSDPVGLSLSTNPYTYVENPLHWTDPAGLAPYHVDIFRGMKATEAGPELGNTARTLGARPGEMGDIPVDASGMVHPNTGGMSVSPGRPENLPVHRRPPQFGGTGKDPVWRMNTRDLPEGLAHRPDPLNPTGHGFVEPSRSMPFEEYQGLLESTRGAWQRL